jgi:GT2 family glycosyltransferase
VKSSHREKRANVGAVVIGRNEGARLEACLRSLHEQTACLVYVDSGSTDDSLAVATRFRADVVELDNSIPFSAARARNEGFKLLRKVMPDAAYVQFVDGDCEVAPDWVETAANFLDSDNSAAVVCGRRRERYPHKSLYNLLCDIEWDTPIGEARACGGDALMRIDAFEGVTGFREDLISGEEPELCFRLRQKGWRIWCLNAEMTLHDAAMTRFAQWWRRSVRTGYGYAEGALLHGQDSERYLVRASLRAWIWALVLPLGIALLSRAHMAWLWLLLIYPLQVGRLALAGTRTRRENWVHAFFLVLGKFPEALGQLYLLFNRILRRRNKLIEYK